MKLLYEVISNSLPLSVLLLLSCSAMDCIAYGWGAIQTAVLTARLAPDTNTPFRNFSRSDLSDDGKLVFSEEFSPGMSVITPTKFLILPMLRPYSRGPVPPDTHGREHPSTFVSDWASHLIRIAIQPKVNS